MKAFDNAVNYLTQLGVVDDCVKKFKNGCILQSDSDGILWDISDRQISKIAELESKYDDCVVYHIIRGTYILGGVDKVQMETYLIAHDDDGEGLDYGDGYYYVFAYVDNLTWGECGSEYGEVCVRGKNGGIVRVG